MGYGSNCRRSEEPDDRQLSSTNELGLILHKRAALEDLCRSELKRISVAGCSQLIGAPEKALDYFALLTNIASSARMNPGGLPCLERISSHPPPEPTTEICVPLVICATTRDEFAGSS